MTKATNKRKRFWFVLYVAGALAVLGVVAGIRGTNNVRSVDEIKSETFAALDRIRQEKKSEVTTFLEELQEVAFGVAGDSIMLHFFGQLLAGESAANALPPSNLDEYFLSAYGQFYDVLFVDSTGLVVHSMLRESDFQADLFAGHFSDTRLARRLRNSDERSFVEYDFYLPSDEPAAFFIVPVVSRGVRVGWIVLQCPVNRLNAILTGGKMLGRSGEVYLVNREKRMLTDSRFSSSSTILRREVNTSAVGEALESGGGNSVIEDYRGVRVFSSFERIEILGATWVIVAEMDEDEVVTDLYRDHKKHFRQEITRLLSEAPRGGDPINQRMRSGRRIDMAEFAKAAPGTPAYTVGLSTCTGVVMVLPERFGYMAHVPPTDVSYEPSRFPWSTLRNRNADLVNTVLARAAYYDVFPFELRQIHYYLIASHTRSFTGTVDRILDSGVELSNIHFLYNPRAENANVFVDVAGPTVDVTWREKGRDYVENGVEMVDLGSLVKTVVGFDM
jgi:hypothetical protein